MYCSFGEDSRLGFHIKNDDASRSDSMECRILLIDQSSPELSYKIGKPSFYSRLIKESEELKVYNKLRNVLFWR